MKSFYLLLLTALFYQTAYGQLQTFYVTPQSTNGNYAADQDSHYVVLNPSVPSNGKLLVFFPGTGALTKHYTLFPQLAASLGYHCISIAYPNGYPTVAQSCAGSSDVDCYLNIRQEVCYGTDVSPDVTVDTLNSIHNRIVNLLSYLITQYPSQGWDAYLSANEPVWNNIAVSGHSQGSGHALYLAKMQSCERLMMFAGADDYSNYYSQAANWVSSSKQTPVNRYFSFLHLYDDVWDYAKQYAVVQATGMTASGDDSTLVDGASTPYQNSHCLYTMLDPLYPGVYSAKHDGMVVDFYTPKQLGIPVYQPVWNYMLTAEPTATAIVSSENTLFSIYPNPAKETLWIEFYTAPSQLSILNAQGENIYSIIETKEKVEVNVSQLPPGLYFIQIGNQGCRFIKE